MVFCKLLLFTDQSQDPASFLESIFNCSSHTGSLHILLRAFTSGLKEELHLLLPAEKRLIGPLDSIIDIVGRHKQAEEKNVIVSVVLLCISQLVSLHLNADQNSDFLAENVDSNYLLGFCTGFLPALAAGVCTNSEQLLDIGSRIVRVAFRLGLEIHRRSQRIEISCGSWSRVVRGIYSSELQNILDEFHETNKIPLHRQTYISATSSIGSTISGPPSTLQRLFEQSKRLREAHHSILPIHGAFHARHLGLPDIEHIAAPALPDTLILRRNVSFISPTAGTPYTYHSAADLLSQGLKDILQTTISLQSVIKHIATQLQDVPTNILIVGPKWGVKSISQGLISQGVQIIGDQLPAKPKEEVETSGSEDIAIIGMSGKFPGGPSLEDFWKVLEEGKDLHTRIPSSRFDVSRYFDPYGTQEGKCPPPHACFIDEIGLFDNTFFSMSPRESKQTDPTHRLLMMSTYEALEMAGYNKDYLGKVGTYFGQTTDDWRESNAGQDPDVYYVPGTIRAFGPGRLNYFFKWDGPSYSVDTACSSSLAAIELACNALRLGSCDMAVAGGGNVLTGPNMFRGLSKGGFLSPTGSCKTFDNQADGYCRGEAVGVIILKSLRNALADNDNILGVIRGIATNHSAEAMSITHPHQGTQEQLISLVLSNAGVSPSMVDYVELHGTGTQAGDSIEVASVANTFAACSEMEQPLYIGAVKANAGHSEAGAGVTSLIKALMMFQRSKIPPHPGMDQINHKLSFIDDMNIHIPKSSIPFISRSDHRQRRILVNNFNATGGNTCLLLEEYPMTEKKSQGNQTHYPVVLSAKTSKALSGNRARLLRYLRANSDRVSLTQLSYTTTSRRMHHPYRLSWSASSVEDLTQLIAEQPTFETQRSRGPRQIVFTFAGQGVNHRGIGQTLFRDCRNFRESLLSYNEICIRLGFPSFLQYLIDNDEGSASSPIVEQLSLVALEIAMAELWKGWGIIPSMVIGHSLGEYSALCLAGVLSITDTLYIVGKRAELIQEMCSLHTHAMLVTSLSKKSSQEYCMSLTECEISCVNGPSSTVISGPKVSIDKLKCELEAQSIRAKDLPIVYAFHSSHMTPIVSPLRELGNSVSFSKSQIPILSSLLGRVIDAGAVIEPDYLARHIREPVNILGAIGSIQHDDRTAWLECGPGPGCLSMIKTSAKTTPQRCMMGLQRGVDCWKSISTTLAGLYQEGNDIKWSMIFKDFESNIQLLDLPPYAFDTSDFYIDIKDDQIHSKSVQTKTTSLIGTCVQYLDEERIDPRGDVKMQFVSDVMQKDLLAAIEGHCVQGHNLCPSSVYVDMAVTSAKYIYNHRRLMKSEPGTAIEVSDVEIFQPLVVSPGGPDRKVTIQTFLPQGSHTWNVSIGSQLKDGSQTDHSTCNVKFGNDEQWQSEWARYSDMLRWRMNQLGSPEMQEDICHLPGKILYRMFSSIVNYSERYHAISDIFIDCDHNDAYGTIHLPAQSNSESFTLSPYTIDGIIHFAGFILNNSLGTPKSTAYVSSGWGSLQILQNRLASKPYRIYSHMKKSEKKGLFVGDVYLLDGDDIVAACFDLKFNEVRVNLLSRLLGGSLDSGQCPREDTGCMASGRDGRLTTDASSPRQTLPVDIFSRVVKIVEDEIEMHASQISEKTPFEDLGIDSLLSISITGTIQSKLGIPLPTSLFAGDSSLSHIQSYLQDSYSTSETEYSLSSESPAASSSSSSSGVGSDFQQFLLAVSDETGHFPDNLKPETRFEDLGIDSLLSMVILARFQKLRGRGLQSSVFDDYPTLQSMQLFLEGTVDNSRSLGCSLSATADKLVKLTEYANFGRLFQGNPSSGLPPLFLIAPGSGHTGMYSHLPGLHENLPVYTLESPFLQSFPPGGWTVEHAASLYIKEIRRLHPHGPYILGGWSMGGVYCYEVARQLLLEGESISGLLLIDVSCPTSTGMTVMPPATMEAIQLTGMYAPIIRKGLPDLELPLKLKEHTVGSLNALRAYKPVPMEPTRRPRFVQEIWASKGEYDKLPSKIAEATELLRAREQNILPAGQKLEVSKDWQTAPRSSFGPCGWDRLVGDLVIHIVKDADHESIMCPPHIDLTGRYMQDAIRAILAMEN